MTSRRYTTTLVRDGSICFVPVPFDLRPVFGKVRAPVRVTLNGYTYRSTIAAMGGVTCLPLRKSNREAAKLEGDETLSVLLELDTGEREVAIPPELREALARASARAGWDALSFSHRREHVEAIEQAKKPETRQRRIDAALAAANARAARAKKPARTGAAPVAAKRPRSAATGVSVKRRSPAALTASSPKQARAKKAERVTPGRPRRAPARPRTR